MQQAANARQGVVRRAVIVGKFHRRLRAAVEHEAGIRVRRALDGGIVGVCRTEVGSEAEPITI